MLTKEFIIKQFPVLKPTDTGSFALTLMEEYKLRHLPVVEDGKYVSLFSEKDIFSMKNIHEQVRGITVFAPYVIEETHILESLRIMNNDKLTLLPVLDQDALFLGIVTLPVLIEKLSDISNASSNGAIITLEVNPQDYDLSNIVRLAESNNAKVMSVFSYLQRETSKLIVELKIDLEDASAVLRSFERFNYTVLYYFQKSGLSEDIQRRRLEELLYYLRM